MEGSFDRSISIVAPLEPLGDDQGNQVIMWVWKLKADDAMLAQQKTDGYGEGCVCVGGNALILQIALWAPVTC